jgi:AcrR family transcriptional regulator
VAAPTRTPRSSWIDEGLRALGVGGPDAVRIENLAQALGVTKGGFYWHFAGRPALLDEMLDTWERVVTDEVIRTIEGGGGDARGKLRRLFALAVSSDEMLDVELAIREWARRDKAVAKRLRHLDNRRMDYMRPLFAEFCPDEKDVEVRCLLSLTLFVGNPFVAAEHGALSRAAVTSLAIERLLE